MEWRSVVNFEGYYEVSDQGQVRSLDRVIKSKRWPNGRGQPWKGCILVTAVDRDGYQYVTLCRDGKRTTHRIHHLVLEAFVGPRPPDKEARHLDGDETHNWRTNLAWGTKLENEQDRVRHGTHPMLQANRERRRNGSSPGQWRKPQTSTRGSLQSASSFLRDRARRIQRDADRGTSNALDTEHSIAVDLAAADAIERLFGGEVSV